MQTETTVYSQTFIDCPLNLQKRNLNVNAQNFKLKVTWHNLFFLLISSKLSHEECKKIRNKFISLLLHVHIERILTDNRNKWREEEHLFSEVVILSLKEEMETSIQTHYGLEHEYGSVSWQSWWPRAKLLERRGGFWKGKRSVMIQVKEMKEGSWSHSEIWDGAGKSHCACVRARGCGWAGMTLVRMTSICLHCHFNGTFPPNGDKSLEKVHSVWKSEMVEVQLRRVKVGVKAQLSLK